MIMFMSHVRAIAVLLFALSTFVSASGSSPTSTTASAPTATSDATTTSTSMECSIGSASRTVISNAAQASSLASACPTFTGTINIDADDSVALDGMDIIDGNLTSTGSNVTVISSDSISNITGLLNLSQLPNLTAFSFPKLTSVGSLHLRDLPWSVETLSFLETLQKVDEIDVQDTSLSSLEGFDLLNVTSMNVEYNTNMTLINIQVSNITVLNIGANSADTEVKLPKLEWVHNLTLANCSSVSVPALAHVNDTLHLTGNSFSAFDNASTVHTIGDELWVNNNMNLTNISLPELRTVGGHIVIDNNPKLNVLDEIIVLETVGGNVQMNGSFSSISFPALSNVNGSFELNSTTNLDCSIFDTYYKDGVISGNYTCYTPTSAIDKTRNVTSHPDPKHEMPEEVKIGIGIGIPFASLVVALLAALYFLRRMRQARKQQDKDKDGLSELSSDTAIVELGNDKAFPELGRSHSRNVSGPESRHELDDTTSPTELLTPVEDNSHNMDIIIGTFEMEGDTVYPHKPES